MNVILQERVKNLGNIGDQVSVKAGFARNFLIPHGKAVMATEKNIAEFETRRAEFEKTANEKLAAAKATAEKVASLNIEIAAKAGDEGKLFGSVGPREIAMAVTDAGVSVAKSHVDMPEGPIRTTGEFEVVLHLHTDVSQAIQIVVVADNS